VLAHQHQTRDWGRQRENCFETDDSDASYFDSNNIEIDDPLLSENDCVVNKSFNVLNTSTNVVLIRLVTLMLTMTLHYL
jgi:hypothetical protein